MAMQQYSPVNAAYQQARYGAQQGFNQFRSSAADLINKVANPRSVRIAGMASRGLGALAIPVGAGLDYMSRKEQGEDDTRAFSGTLSSTGGGLAGAAAGATIGRRFGPVGTFVGGALGYIAGSSAGGAASDFANDAIRGRYEGYDNNAAALAKSLSDRDAAIASGDPMKAATAYQATSGLIRKARMKSLEQTSALQNVAVVGQGVQDSMQKGTLGQQGTQFNTASALPSYSNMGLEDIDPNSEDYRNEMAARRNDARSRSRSEFDFGLADRASEASFQRQSKMAGQNTRASMLLQYLAGAQQGSNNALIAGFSQRY